jgi:hypothetical protein
LKLEILNPTQKLKASLLKQNLKREQIEVQEFINSESLKDQYHKGIQIELTQVKDERAY